MSLSEPVPSAACTRARGASRGALGVGIFVLLFTASLHQELGSSFLVPALLVTCGAAAMLYGLSLLCWWRYWTDRLLWSLNVWLDESGSKREAAQLTANGWWVAHAAALIGFAAVLTILGLGYVVHGIVLLKMTFSLK
ncbi:hypothetical protein R5W24_002570 [Gemmata sp. JC717]|uniref:hypothetical protein n=1 Tax=Gemmata algarum TaxID=2975278 RepID=UPI0021BB11FE|nr:hypothetical protein [Gemmata algarum]MDY3553468.1 hypothetical protein [Gemmata algarum]